MFNNTFLGQSWDSVGSLTSVQATNVLYTLDVTSWYNANLGKTMSMFMEAPFTPDSGDGVTFEDKECSNTGDAPLKITKVTKTCGYMARPDKTEYKPGEGGSLKVQYRAAGKGGMKVKKQLYVFTNNKTNPQAMVTVKAHVAATITFEPERMDL